METKNMKNKTTSLLKWMLGLCLLFIGAQGAFAMECEGTIYIQLPSSWASAIINMDGNALAFPKTMTNGWYVFDAKALGAAYSKEFIIMEKEGGWNDGGITTKSYGVAGGPGGWDQKDKFSCTDIEKTGQLYIYADPTTEGKTAYTSDPPNAKYLFMLVPPEKEDWMSSTPMVSMDGGVTGSPMKPAPGMCGWYYYVWFGEKLTDNVVFYRDDDPTKSDLIGMNGNWEQSANATPIPLEMLFGTVDTLYFVPDEDLKEDDDDGWFESNPEVDGVCEYTLAAIIYDTDASLHGAFTCNPDWVAGQDGTYNACYYASVPYQVVSSAKASVPCIGVTTGMVAETLNNVKGTPNYKKPVLTAKGQGCFGADANNAFTAMFNSTPNVNETYCVDIPFTKSSDNKWEFDSDTYKSNGATVPGGFYPAEESPSPDRLMSAALPAAENKRKAEGPVFMCAGLRAIDPVEGAPYSDLLCKGPGWSKGENCEGLFAGGSEFSGEFNNVEFRGDGWGWGCPEEAPNGWVFYTKGTEKSTGAMKGTQMPTGESRWGSGASDSNVLTTGGRNQHFCFESHAQFTYKKGLRFSFRGDDDIWVYIDNKLAVDLGGTHLAAPGYVDLDKFVGTSVGGFVEGSQYDLDIFFCDRRTTMSNVRIKTNMYIIQKTDISYKKTPAATGGNNFELCYNKSGDGSCAAAMVGSGDESISCCGAEISSVCGAQVSYVLVKGNKIEEGAETRDAAGVAGIDLTNPYGPTINKSKVKLPPGRWTLYVVIDGKYKKIETFRTTGSVDVVDGDAVAIYFNDDEEEIRRANYKFVGSAMGGPLSPSIDDMIPFYVSAVAGEEEGKVVMQPGDAIGVNYSLTIPSGMTVYVKNAGTLVPISSGDPLTVNETGVDTLYAYVSLMSLTGPTQDFKVMVNEGKRTASFTFYLPRLSFVDSTGQAVTKMSDNVPELWVGSFIPFNLVALKPNNDGTGSYSECTTCNFSYFLGSESSPQIEAKPNSELNFKNGKATVEVRSLKEYRRGVESAKIVIVGDNPLMTATYEAYFREPPVPYPVLADVFDVKGKAAGSETAKIYSAYQASEYLDGIADSVSIYFHRAIHPDSLPLALCILWDSTSAEKLNAYEKGYATIGDTIYLCNAVVDRSGYSCLTPDDSNYCAARLDIGGLNLSSSVKTGGSGKVVSFSEFKDVNVVVKQPFDGALTDRIAPIPLSASITPNKDNEDYSNLTIYMSEPVQLLDDKNMNGLSFYLKNSTLDSASRMMPLSGVGVPTPSVDDKGRAKIDVLYCTNSKKVGCSASYPQEGDFVRLSGSLLDVQWRDKADITSGGRETLREAADATYYWNSPTGYNESKRLPTPWLIIGGRTPAYIYDVNFAHTGNAALCEKCTNVITPFVVSSFDDKEQIIKSMNGLPGHFVTSNMLSIYSQIVEGEEGKPGEDVNMEDFYFYYKVEYFTNLGAYVAGHSGKIYCKDDLNIQKNNGATYFGGAGHDCTESGTYFYLAWNMNSDKGRQVGTGAYISKMETYVRANGAKKNSKDETSVFGVKKDSKPYTRTWEDYKKNHNVAE